jgi:hypothetical protein
MMLRVIFQWIWFYSLSTLASANLQFLHLYRVLFIGVANMPPLESISCGQRHTECGDSGSPDNNWNRNTDCHPRYIFKPLKSSPQNPFKGRLKFHPVRLSANSCTMHHISVLRLFLYFLRFNSLPHSATLDLQFSKWNLHPARWGITIHRRIKKHT